MSKKRSKKSEKTVDTPLHIWDIVTTHGNNRTKNMRTKTLLIAAAAMAVGAATSMAQTTYSQNIVGYVNQKVIGGQYNMMVNPLTGGTTNGANEVFNGKGAVAFTGYLPDGTQLFQWNGTAYVVSTYDTTVGADDNNWYNGDESDVAPTPLIKPGQGFFLLPTATFTNTYAGSVVVNVGGTTNNVSIASQYNMLGSLVPYAGAVSNLTINLYPPDGSQLFQWNGTAYVVSTYDTTVGAAANNWYNGDESDVAPTPVINVGDGFFLLPTAPYTWTQTL